MNKKYIYLIFLFFLNLSCVDAEDSSDIIVSGHYIKTSIKADFHNRQPCSKWDYFDPSEIFYNLSAPPTNGFYLNLKFENNFDFNISMRGWNAEVIFPNYTLGFDGKNYNRIYIENNSFDYGSIPIDFSGSRELLERIVSREIKKLNIIEQTEINKTYINAILDINFYFVDQRNNYVYAHSQIPLIFCLECERNSTPYCFPELFPND